MLRVSNITPTNRHHSTRYKQVRLYIDHDETLWENFFNRRARPVSEYRKKVVPEALKYLGLPADTKVRWSQYGGCACGCSPAFIVPIEQTNDLHIHVEEDKV